jgi:hypothetical protein
MANRAETYNVIYNKEKMHLEYQLKLRIDGKSETVSHVYIVQQDFALWY